MSQKINALGFRLKKRLNWLSQFAIDEKGYSKSVFTTMKSSFYTKIFFQKFGFFFNNTYFVADSIKKQAFLGLGKLSNSKDLNSNNFGYNKSYNKLKSLTLNAFYAKKPKDNWKPNYSFFRSVSCNLICEYIADQLKKPTRLRNKSFIKNINIGLLELTNGIIKENKKNILGLKIICSGRWQKTRSGRKQNVIIRVGNLKTPTVSSLLYYHYLQTTTKQGACGIKVWVCFKK